MKKFPLIFLCCVLLGCGRQQELGDRAAKLSADTNSVSTATPSILVAEDKINVTTEIKAGYPHGNTGEYQRYVCSDDNWVYIAQNMSHNKCKLFRSKKNSSKVECIYKNNNGQIFAINAYNDWIVFVISESTKYDDRICRIKNDGTQYKVLSELSVADLWLYNNKIYYSEYTKWGGKDIYSMDLNGNNINKIYEKQNALEFEVANDKIFVYSFYDNYYNVEKDEESNDCVLYQMDLEGRNKQKVCELFDAYPDEICLWENSVYYINEQEELCKVEIGNDKVNVLASEVEKYCIYNNWIYYTKAYNNKLCRVDLSGENLTSLDTKNILKENDFDIVLDGQIYFESDDKELIRMDCSNSKVEKIELKGN